MHFDPTLPVTLACDSSSYGMGAVLSHRLPDGEERPIAFASKSLNKAQRNYAQIEREALAIYWGVKRFRYYWEGRDNFILQTDHKPLRYIMDRTREVPETAAARLQRWCLFLGAFRCSIEFRSTEKHANCDGLSRLPLPGEKQPGSTEETDKLYYASVLDPFPVTAKMLRRATRQDPILAVVADGTLKGWESHNREPELKPFYDRKDSITSHEGVLFWGSRAIVPAALRERMLDVLHEGHLGMAKSKAVARGYVWWPNLDKDIEKMIRRCQGCQETAAAPAATPLHRWEYPARIWQRLHIDFAGPFQGLMYLLLVDAFSKWPEIVEMESTSAEDTIDELRAIFARFGLPEQIVSDNGPQFTSEAFQKFTSRNGIKHVTGAPYHPATNGLAERLVRSFKRAKKADTSARSHRTKLARFLLAYRTAPHTSTEQTPASMLIGRPLRTRLALVTSDVRQTVDDRTLVNAPQRFREFRNGETVWVRNYRSTIPWVKGWILERTGPVSYTVAIAGNVIWKRHVSQLRDAEEDDELTESAENHTSASRENTRPLAQDPRELSTEQQPTQEPTTRASEGEEAEICAPGRRDGPASPGRRERATQGERVTSRVRPTTPPPASAAPQPETTPRPEPVAAAGTGAPRPQRERQRPRWHPEYEVEYC